MCDVRIAKTLALALTITTMGIPARLIQAQAPTADGKPATTKFSTAQLDFFENKIRPVMVEHCYQCHSGTSKRIQGGFRLDSREALLKGGDSGPAVVPGDADGSLLMEALRYESLEMPPKGKLPANVIGDFGKWIEQGAADPRRAEAIVRTDADVTKARQYWSFQPVRRPAIPETADSTWPHNEVDRFVLARLETKGLTPAADASRAALIRRAYFDVIGLPPTPRAIAEFETDPDPNAFAKVVDRLLASAHFGERWGRHWLDVARYADSSGGGRTLILENAWRYRDYVVNAFNNDKPYDRFISEQITGDLLAYDTYEERREQLTATGFLVLGPNNYELQDKTLLQMEVVDEQIDTIGRSMLGMSIGCARCHDHKFDPVPTTDYYALAGIFRSTKSLVPGNVSGFVQRALPYDSEHAAALATHEKTLVRITDRLNPAKLELKRLQTTLAPAADTKKLPGIVIDDSEAELFGAWSHSTSVRPFVGAGYIYSGSGDKGMQTATFIPDIPKGGLYEVRVAYTPASNRASNTPVVVRHAEGEASTTLDQRVPPSIDDLFVSIGRFPFSKGRSGSLTISNTGTDGHAIADGVQLLAVNAAGNIVDESTESGSPQPKKADERVRKIEARIATLKDEVKKLTAEKKQLEKNAPRPAPMVMSVHEQEEPADCQVCIRGSVHNLGDKVPRGFLSAVSIDRTPSVPADHSGRLELARWLTDPDNPLTARVMANRIWHHLFGTGLVRTTDNFGTTGEPPSHPDLLDWLAVRFVKHGWSVKQLIREIMMSRTYQLGSEPNSTALSADPENRLVWRMSRRRLDAESIRDAILLIAGSLDRRQSGPGMRPGTKSEFNYKYDSQRRSVYLPVFRNTLYDFFDVFDFANTNLVTGRRSTSTLPTQSLYLMNSPFVQDQARLAARHLLEIPNWDDTARLRFAYLQAIGREPSAREQQLAQQFLADFPAVANNPAQLDAWTGIYHSLFACVDFRYVY